MGIHSWDASIVVSPGLMYLLLNWPTCVYHISTRLFTLSCTVGHGCGHGSSDGHDMPSEPMPWLSAARALVRLSQAAWQISIQQVVPVSRSLHRSTCHSSSDARCPANCEKDSASLSGVVCSDLYFHLRTCQRRGHNNSCWFVFLQPTDHWTTWHRVGGGISERTAWFHKEFKCLVSFWASCEYNDHWYCFGRFSSNSYAVIISTGIMFVAKVLISNIICHFQLPFSSRM